MSKDTGGPAFPENTYRRVGETEKGDCKPGMTLHDYFVGQCNISWQEAIDILHILKNKTPTIMEIINVRIEIKNWEADALIKERNK